MAFRKLGAAAATAVTLALGATPSLAATEIQWWHAMTGANNDVIVKLANDFNASQSDYKVIPTYKGNYADTMEQRASSRQRALKPVLRDACRCNRRFLAAALCRK